MKRAFILCLILFSLTFSGLMLIPDLSINETALLAILAIMFLFATIGSASEIYNEKIIKDKKINDVYFNNICNILHGKNFNRCTKAEIDEALDHFYDLEVKREIESRKSIKHLN